MEFVTGDIIYVQSDDITRLIDHTGIVVLINGEKYIYHSTPDRFNAYGGSICSDKLMDWIARRNIKRVVNSGISTNQILSVSYNLRRERYNFLTFNCEHYTTYIVEGVRRSNQLNTYLLLIVIAFIAIKSK